jgi:hypothetical protein
MCEERVAGVGEVLWRRDCNATGDGVPDGDGAPSSGGMDTAVRRDGKKAGAGKGAFYIDGYPYSSFNLPLLWRKKIAFSFGIYEPFITVPYNINLLQ